eukprot:TRINITY_DN59337_c0_g1_i1.p1 TRINITY_DN59337_c0_g1~~TRINITY_DN59337_c0_g1_i1.p1  ORF type:complete len:171 (-),score=30.34 TRINITY_DN59337_c0_g1_i1:234-686(-)
MIVLRLLIAVASVRSALGFQQKISSERSNVGSVAELNEIGYQQVLAARSEDAMRTFVLRLLEDAGVQLPESELPPFDRFVQSLTRTNNYASLAEVQTAMLASSDISKGIKDAVSRAFRSLQTLASNAREHVAASNWRTAYLPRTIPGVTP